MPIIDTSIFKERTVILSAMLTALQDAVPQVYIGEDGIARILFEIESGQLESAYLAAQLLLEDVFPQTASAPALRMHGDTYSVAFINGINSSGILRFEGAGGTVIPVGSQVGVDPGNGLELFLFVTTDTVTIPDPGTPTAPMVVINVTAGNLTGTYEYVVTYLSAEGETLRGAISDPVYPASQRVNISAIPSGGAGTTGRRIYRAKNGSPDFKLVTTINDNTTSTFTDNVADGSVGPSMPPELSTAESVSVAASASRSGTDGNVQPGAITVLVGVPTGVTGVTNTSAFEGGTNQEDIEHYRQRLLQYIRNPRDGSTIDYKFWAEQIDGVDQATVYNNDNLGTPTYGHVTVRIAGPNGIIPAAGVITATQAYLDQQDVANIIVHVGTFTTTTKTVSVTLTLAPGTILADVTPSVQDAIIDYVNSIPIGGTFYKSGLIDAIYGLAGILDVTTTNNNSTAAATAKYVTAVADITIS